MNISNIMDLLAVCALAVSVSVGVMTGVFFYKVAQANVQMLKFGTTTKTFETISGKENKERWRKIYIEYWKLKSQGKPVIFDDKDIKDEAYRLREALNQVGVLFNAGLLDNKILFDTFGGVFIKLWTAIREDVKYDREARNPEAMKFFEKMYNAAVKHWTKSNGSVLPEPHRGGEVE